MKILVAQKSLLLEGLIICFNPGQDSLKGTGSVHFIIATARLILNIPGLGGTVLPSNSLLKPLVTTKTMLPKEFHHFKIWCEK